MEVRLVVERGGRRQVCRIQSPRAVVGRARGNTVRIPSAEVSREHCRLMLEDGLVYVRDLDSINGTFLNGRPVRGVEVIQPGDRLEVGPVVFVVEYELTPEALRRLRRGGTAPAILAVPVPEDVETVEFEFDIELLEEPGAAVRRQKGRGARLDFDYDLDKP